VTDRRHHLIVPQQKLKVDYMDQPSFRILRAIEDSGDDTKTEDFEVPIILNAL